MISYINQFFIVAFGASLIVLSLYLPKDTSMNMHFKNAVLWIGIFFVALIVGWNILEYENNTFKKLYK